MKGLSTKAASHMIKCIFMLYMLVNAVQAQKPEQHAQLLERADSLSRKAVYYSDAFNSDSATYFFRLAADTYFNASDTLNAAISIVNLAKEYVYVGKFDTSVQILDSLIQSEVGKNSRATRYVAYRGKGYALLSQGRLVPALHALDSAHNSNYGDDDAERKDREARISFLKGFAHLYLNNLTKAESCFEVSRKIYTEFGNEYRLAETLNHFASLKTQLFKADEAIAMFRQSMALYKKQGGEDVSHLASLQTNLGNTYRYLNMNSYAIDALKASAKNLRVLKADNPNLTITLAHLADIYNQSDNPQAALPAIEEALKLARQYFEYGDNDFRITQNSFVLGNTYRLLGEHQKAIEIYEKAIVNLQNALPGLGLQWIAVLRIARGATSLELETIPVDDAFAEMKAGLDQLILLGMPHQREAIQNAQLIAATYLDQNLPDSALKYYNVALEIEQNDKGSGFPSPQLAFHMRRRQSLLGKVAVYQKKYQEDHRSRWLDSAFKSIVLAKDEVASLNAFPNGLTDELETSRALSKSNNIGINVCYELYKLHGEQKYAELAFELIEQNKSGRFMFNADIASENATGMPDSLLLFEKNLMAALSAVETSLYHELEKDSLKDTAQVKQFRETLEDLTQEMVAFRQQVRENYPGYFLLKFHNQYPGISEIQRQLLHKNELLINYHINENYLYIFCIDRKGFRFEKRELSESFYTALSGLIKAIREPDVSQESLRKFIDHGFQLKETLMPDPDVISEHTALLIIPDKSLYFLPFEILMTNQPTDPTGFRDLPYLFGQYDIRYGTSTQLLLHQQRHYSSAPFKLAAFAPVFEPTQPFGNKGNSQRAVMSNLPFTKDEIEGIARHYDTQLFEGAKATEKEFRNSLTDYSAIHIASHGLIDHENALYSKILFSQFQTDSVNDGFLNTREILALTIPAQMVVLSACNSGKVDPQSGNGIMSMANGFFYAGARSVVMSLWTANDQSTSALMNSFYKNLKEGHEKSRALTMARKEYLSSANKITAHPYYWAHFVINGDPRPLLSEASTGYLWFILLVPLAFIFIRNAQNKKRQAA